ncbi:MAG TPA: hypothetical protein VNF75_09170 [Candidatus Dormibacteraeota bacterium]|nr:hypothetical protein [Candidatus Dormibacteraeota bacterium]
MAEAEAAKQVDIRHLQVSISAETYVSLKRASKGKTVENFAADILDQAAKR